MFLALSAHAIHSVFSQNAVVIVIIIFIRAKSKLMPIIIPGSDPLSPILMRKYGFKAYRRSYRIYFFCTAAAAAAAYGLSMLTRESVYAVRVQNMG